MEGYIYSHSYRIFVSSENNYCTIGLKIAVPTRYSVLFSPITIRISSVDYRNRLVKVLKVRTIFYQMITETVWK